MVNYKQIGGRIQRARKLNNLSVADLAQKVGFTPKSVIYAENGQAVLSLDLFTSLCTALNVTPNDLLEGEYRRAAPHIEPEQDAATKEMQKLIESLRNDLGMEERGGTVYRDTQSVIKEFHETVSQFKAQKGSEPLPSARRAAVAKEKTKKRIGKSGVLPNGGRTSASSDGGKPCQYDRPQLLCFRHGVH